MAAPRSSSLFLYLLIAVCLLLLAPYFGVHLFVTEPPESIEGREIDGAPKQEHSALNDDAPRAGKPSKALSDIEDLLER